MRPRPFYRWRSFWLGVLVLGFLGWGWGKSIKANSGLFIVAPPFFNGEISQEGSTVRIGSMHPTGAANSVITWDEPSPPVPHPPPRLPVAFQLDAEGGEWIVRVAHWFLILLFLVPWSALLLWRGRRRNRAGLPGPLDPPPRG